MRTPEYVSPVPTLHENAVKIAPTLCINLNEKVVNVGFYVPVIRQEMVKPEERGVKEFFFSLKNTLFFRSFFTKKREMYLHALRPSECAKTLITVVH